VGLIIFPAIDLRSGKVVRLRQGDPAAQTVFSDDPVATAQSWESAGAKWLHIVNLDGALLREETRNAGTEGQSGASASLPINLQVLASIRAATTVPIQFGGGIRTEGEAACALGLGATRVILGTVAIENPAIVAAVVDRFGPGRVVIALDARGEKVSTHGWQTVSPVEVLSAARQIRSMGVLRALYTDVARDGMLAGVNVAATVELARSSGLRVIASGGVATLDDIRALAAHSQEGVEGVVVGQAIYTGALDLAAAIAAGLE
jgi:phosphoribosylformimino-5-aminoimidazole carboxamide ribotide isomerase